MLKEERFFEPSIQDFLNMLQSEDFRELACNLSGYDLSLSGKMLYPGQSGA
ncbi:MAG: hypothetical protein R6U27_16080 [Desulfobacterales bacterium]